MHKIWFGAALAAVIAGPVLAQDYHRNMSECVKELGLVPQPYGYKIQSDGRTHRKVYLHSEAQFAMLNDCVARKASLAGNSSASSGKPRASQ